MDRKTDNTDLRAKLDLRRYFLRRYHTDDAPHVLDCCQGEGLIWKQLRREFPVGSYWGVDVKKKSGRLALDSVRILQQPGWPQNVVDVDTYGSPWKHWEAMLPNVSQPTTVFLTAGLVRIGGGGGLDRVAVKALRLEPLLVPPGIAGSLHGIALGYLLTMSCEHEISIAEAVEAVSTGSARYFGVRLVPTGTRTRGGAPHGCRDEVELGPRRSCAMRQVGADVPNGTSAVPRNGQSRA